MVKNISYHGTSFWENHDGVFIECPNCSSRSSHSTIQFNCSYKNKDGIIISSLCLACSSKYHTCLTFDELKSMKNVNSVIQ
jgi:hypothetical protein